MESQSEKENNRSELLPNTTQTPNLILDHCMAYLTGDEFKVLMYTVRRTYGFWKDRDRIGLSQYADGIVGADGNIKDMGTGLSKPCISKALKRLIDFNIIVVEDEAKGAEAALYSLNLNDDTIKWGDLILRQDDKDLANQERVEAMRQRLAEKRAQESGQSDRTLTEDSERSVGLNASGQWDRTQAVSGTDTQNQVLETKYRNQDSANAANASSQGDDPKPQAQLFQEGIEGKITHPAAPPPPTPATAALEAQRLLPPVKAVCANCGQWTLESSPLCEWCGHERPPAAAPEPVTPPLPKPPDGYQWMRTSADNEFAHLTPLSRERPPLCKRHPWTYPDRPPALQHFKPCPVCIAAASAPKPKRERKARAEPKPREPNHVFDAIALGSFNMTKVGSIGATSGGRIGKLVKGVKDCTPEEHQATLAADLAAMYAWYKTAHKDIDAPAAVETICKYLAEWRALGGKIPPPKNGNDKHDAALDSGMRLVEDADGGLHWRAG